MALFDRELVFRLRKPRQPQRSNSTPSQTSPQPIDAETLFEENAQKILQKAALTVVGLAAAIKTIDVIGNIIESKATKNDKK